MSTNTENPVPAAEAGAGIASLVGAEVARQLEGVRAELLKCPIPIVKAKKEMDLMAVGDQLEVTATDPGSVPDFQGWVKTARHARLKEQRTAKDETGRDIYVHLLERA